MSGLGNGEKSKEVSIKVKYVPYRTFYCKMKGYLKFPKGEGGVKPVPHFFVSSIHPEMHLKNPRGPPPFNILGNFSKFLKNLQ